MSRSWEHIDGAQLGYGISVFREIRAVARGGRAVAGYHDDALRRHLKDGIENLPVAAASRRIDDDDIGMDAGGC